MKHALHKIARTLAELFYPLAEVTLFDTEGKEMAVFNRLDTSKKWKKSQKPSYVETLSDGRRVKVAEVALSGCVMRIRYDTSLLLNLHAQLGHLLGNQHEEETSWEKQIDTLIKNFLKERQITLEGTRSKEKRELIYTLNTRGVFKYKEAAHYLAKALNMSRASVYNYLKQATAISQVSIHQVDAFTQKRFGGNPAGVVLDAEHLDEELMKKITREMNLSETAFVLPSKKGDFKLRYFTPTGDEVVFCGHSTVGSLYMLALEKRLQMIHPGHYDFQVETLAGMLSMEIEIDEENRVTILYETPKIRFEPSSLSKEELCDALGINPAILSPRIPVGYEKTNKTLLLAVRSLKDLGKVSLDMKKAEAFAKKHGIVVFGLLTCETFDKAHDVHVRCFAPVVGIPEDPFTGSILGGLSAFLYENGLIVSSKQEIGVEQGHFIKRPGNVKIRVKKEKNFYHATILAHAVHLFSTQMQLGGT